MEVTEVGLVGLMFWGSAKVTVTREGGFPRQKMQLASGTKSMVVGIQLTVLGSEIEIPG